MLQQIQSIQPDFICALGKFAAQTLLQTDRPISRLRGQFFRLSGDPVDADFSSVLSAAQPGEEARGMGGYAEIDGGHETGG